VFLFIEILFFLSAYAMLHTYIFYPFLVYVFSKNKSEVVSDLFQSADEWPDITVICAAYNEEKVIEEKIKSTFATSYPKEKISFYIGTDACSDNTVSIIKKLQEKYPALKLVEFTERTGKIGIINRLFEEAKTPVFIMTDANVFFKENTFCELVKHFKNADIKLVCGNIVKIALNKETITKNELQYMHFENILKSAESKLWSIVLGAEGGCYAIRKESCPVVPLNFNVDDFFITCNVLSNGGKILFEDKAVVYEDTIADTEGEFRRKARIATGNFQNLFYFKKLVLRFWTSASFAFLSHKVFRWLTPFLFLINCVASALLIRVNGFFEIVFCFQMLILITPLLSSIVIKLGIKIKPLISLSHFVIMNAALVTGFYRYCKGVERSVWQPVKR
jgi:cellulose synthase/poly-beta-1,6-N-acetylglucosamine synthase-like glycosyltransferase